MNNSTWLRSACIHIGGIESTLTTKLTTSQMNQVWHSLVTFLQSILYSTPNSVVYLPCPKLNCLMWTFFLCSDWLPGRATWTYIIGTGFPQWGKRQKRSKTSASEASPAVDWGGGNRPFSSPDFLSAPGRFFFFVFPPLWTWSQARISRVGLAKKFSFWPYNQSFINQLVRSRWLDIGLLIDPDFVSVHKTAKKNLANDQLSWPQAWSITHKCERAVIPLPWGITLLKQGKIHGKFREVKIRIEFPFPETMREKGNSFRRNDFWDRLGGQALLW